MAEEEQNAASEIIKSLNEENSGTLLPNPKIATQQSKDCTENQLTKEGNSSMMKEPILEHNKERQSKLDGSVDGVGIEIIPRSTTPIANGIVWAAQSAAQNPALQRALKFMRDEVSSKRALMRSHTIEGRGVGNAQTQNSPPFSSVRPHHPKANESRAASDTSQNEQSNHKHDFFGISSSDSLIWEPNLATYPSPALEDHAKDKPLMLTSPMYMRDSSTPSNVPKNYISILPMKPMQVGYSDTRVSTDPFLGVSARNQVEAPVPQPSRTSRGLPPLPPRKPEAASSSRVEKNLQNPPDQSQPAGKRVKRDNEKMVKDRPRVMTNGGNPNGKIIEGFLCKYTEVEVLIMCACHNKVFTPKEFVKHAGGGDGGNPYRLIKMADGF